MKKPKTTDDVIITNIKAITFNRVLVCICLVWLTFLTWHVATQRNDNMGISAVVEQNANWILDLQNEVGIDYTTPARTKLVQSY